MRRPLVIGALSLAMAATESRADPPAGNYVIDVGGAESILLPGELSGTSCETSDGVTICIAGTLATDGSGFVAGSASGEVTGAMTGILQATLIGFTRGSTTNTKVRLSIAMSGVLGSNGFSLDFAGKGKMQCDEAGVLSGVACRGRMKLCAFDAGKKVACESEPIEFVVADEGGPWQLHLALSTAQNGRVSGMAEVGLANGEILVYQASGKYDARSDTTNLRLVGTGDAVGSKIKLSKLALGSGPGALGGRLAFKIAGQVGSLTLPDVIDGEPFPGHGQCIPGGYCESNQNSGGSGR